MSPELGGRDEGLFRPPLSEVPTSGSITLDVADCVSRLCFSKLASLRGWLDTDSDGKSFRRLLFKGSSLETYPLFRPLSCRLVANLSLGGILTGREDNEETMDYGLYGLWTISAAAGEIKRAGLRRWENGRKRENAPCSAR